ncbi:hypothetical protein TNCV_3376751 [Trichonephila clavipes]|nr:hypothetical protein TNCV_3376751 [Trichonephila clavipes]
MGIKVNVKVRAEVHCVSKAGGQEKDPFDLALGIARRWSARVQGELHPIHLVTGQGWSDRPMVDAVKGLWEQATKKLWLEKGNQG